MKNGPFSSLRTSGFTKTDIDGCHGENLLLVFACFADAQLDHTNLLTLATAATITIEFI